MADKKLYWIKLPRDFFSSPRMKKLRKIAGGDTYTIIYLKMQLLSAEKDGLIEFEGIEPTMHEELALVLDEDPENVRVTLAYLESVGLMESGDEAVKLTGLLTGSENTSTERVRQYRERKALQCNTDVTECNADETQEKEKEIEIDKDIKEKVNQKEKRATFKPPTLEEVRAYCRDRGDKVDPELWFNHYTSNGWMVGRAKMKDWKAAVRTWEKNGIRAPGNKDSPGRHKGRPMTEETMDAIKQLERRSLGI